MAGMSTATGIERRSGWWAWPPNGPRMPAATGDGCGAYTCAPIATPTAATPATMSRTPAIPATRARSRTGARGGGAHPVCGQAMTTRNPATRRHSTFRNPPSPPSFFPEVLYPRSLIFQ